jgi:exosome complex RNA-binding protein Rrp42 (RNase PH superfamily)
MRPSLRTPVLVLRMWGRVSYQLFFSAEVVPLSSLCILPGKAVWVLYVDATCINYNGNAYDATLVAMVAALKNSMCSIGGVWLSLTFILARLPKATFDEDYGRTVWSRKTRVPLQVTRLPISMSFGIFDSYVFVIPIINPSLTTALGRTSLPIRQLSKSRSSTQTFP